MKKFFITIALVTLLLLLLTACGKSETPAPTAVVEAPLQQATIPPTLAPVQTTAPVAVAQTEAPAPQQPPPAAPSIDGRELLESRCISCHSLDRVTKKTATQEEWGQIVTRMIGGGAELTDEEKSILVQYLAETYKK